MNSTIKIESLPPNKSTELVIREGKAEEIDKPVRLTVEGDIHSVKNWIKKRRPEADAPEEDRPNPFQSVLVEESIILVDKDSLSITLQTLPNSVHGTKVTAKLTDNVELISWDINGMKKWTREEIVKKLRFSKRHFLNIDEYDKVLKAFMKLDIKTSAEIKAGSDQRGNKDALYNKLVDSATVPTEFTLNMPLFEGEAKLSFRVEVCLDTTDGGGVKFWFESPELVELRDREIDFIFKAELEGLEKFLVINV